MKQRYWKIGSVVFLLWYLSRNMKKPAGGTAVKRSGFRLPKITEVIDLFSPEKSKQEVSEAKNIVATKVEETLKEAKKGISTEGMVSGGITTTTNNFSRLSSGGEKSVTPLSTVKKVGTQEAILRELQDLNKNIKNSSAEKKEQENHLDSQGNKGLEESEETGSISPKPEIASGDLVPDVGPALVVEREHPVEAESAVSGSSEVIPEGERGGDFTRWIESEERISEGKYGDVSSLITEATSIDEEAPILEDISREMDKLRNFVFSSKARDNFNRWRDSVVNFYDNTFLRDLDKERFLDVLERHDELVGSAVYHSFDDGVRVETEQYLPIVYNVQRLLTQLGSKKKA